MAGTNEILNKELIKDPQLWKLALRVEKAALHVVLYSIIEENSLIYRKIEFDKASSSQLKSLEDVVYENSLLLSDFSRVDCVIETSVYAIVPPEITSLDAREKVIKASFPDFDGEIVPCEISEQGATILMGVENEIIAFLRRTFNNPHLHHNLSPLCRYFFHRNGHGNSTKMYACMRQGKVDVIAVNGDGLRFANTFDYRNPMDAVYYIMASRQMLGMDNATDEMFLSGSPSARESVAETLRKYISYVMPVIFPSAIFKAGKEAMKAPFDLVVLPLCE